MERKPAIKKERAPVSSEGEKKRAANLREKHKRVETKTEDKLRPVVVWWREGWSAVVKRRKREKNAIERE